MAALNLTGKTGISSVKIKPPDESVMPKIRGLLIIILFCHLLCIVALSQIR
jgi:hypothetical protein